MGWLVALGALAFVVLLLRFINIVRYELRDDALCIVYGPLCLRRVPYSDIISVERGTPLWNEHYNRLSTDPNICLRLRRGALSKNLVINPPQTESFLVELRAKLNGIG